MMVPWLHRRQYFRRKSTIRCPLTSGSRNTVVISSSISVALLLLALVGCCSSSVVDVSLRSQLTFVVLLLFNASANMCFFTTCAFPSLCRIPLFLSLSSSVFVFVQALNGRPVRSPSECAFASRALHSCLQPSQSHLSIVSNLRRRIGER